MLLPRRASSIRRCLCLTLLSVAACLLVLLQALQLPNAGLASFGGPLRSLSKPGDNSPADDAVDYSWMTKFQGPVPSICHGPESACLERWLLSHGAHLASNDGQYRIPAVLHIVAADPANRNHLARVGALLLDWHRLHRNWTYVLWTEAEVRRLASVSFRRYLPLIEGGSDQVLTHLAPLLIMQKFGGVLANSDHRPTRNIDPLRRLPAVFAISGRWPELFSADPGLFMAAPGHAFLQYCTDQTLHRPTSHGGLTRLMLDYAAAFPGTERPESSLHLAVLLGSPTTSQGQQPGIADPGKNGSEGQSGDGHGGRLGILGRKCDQLAHNHASLGSWWPLDIGCQELGELRRFLEGGSDAFVRDGASDDLVDRAKQRPSLPAEQLASVFPLLNVGMQVAWKPYS